jgi:putative ABC transport system substrate-binding protein
LFLLIAPLAGESQQVGKVYRIGFLGSSSPSDHAVYLRAFRDSLRDLGYEEGRNILIEYRWAEGRQERLPTLAADLVRSNPDLFVTYSTPGVRAAQQATSTIPIVMGQLGADPVRLGLVKSLARPGGNTTGVASNVLDLEGKRLELLREAVPKLRQIVFLSNLVNPGVREVLKETEVAALKLGVRVRSVGVPRAQPEMDSVFDAILRERPDSLIVQAEPVTVAHFARIAEFASRNRLPTMGVVRQFVAEGGLMSYGSDFREGWRVAARYVDRVLQGAKPADLPVEQSIKFELVINLKTANALGLTIPQSVLARADEIIR